MDYEPVICFETHVELKTQSKLFCRCPASYGKTPNSRICPVCTGQPGALPVLNRKAVEYTVRAGLALNCSINRRSRFARKNYFYPDLPKGYQISQYELPFCENGSLEILGDDGRPYPVGIRRIHLEEDAGKLIHSSSSFSASEYSLVDYNRSSIPLLEIVADHQRNPLRSVKEARAYLEKLRQILIHIDVSDCMMERGQFRSDVNVSVRPRDSKEPGNRTEIKNMASFKFILEAIEYEIKRQTGILESQGEIHQETRLFDEEKGMTLPMRSKEDAPDYRYFPDPDLMEVEIDEAFLAGIRKSLPELPDEKVNRFLREYQIPRNDALILTRDRIVSVFFERCARTCEDRKRLSRWMLKDLFQVLNAASIPMEKCPIKPEDFSHLINLISRGELTDRISQSVLAEMVHSGGNPGVIAEERDLSPIKDVRLLEKIVDEVIEENPQLVSRVRAGATKPVNFLMGRAMEKTEGKANPKTIRELLRKKLQTH